METTYPEEPLIATRQAAYEALSELFGKVSLYVEQHPDGFFYVTDGEGRVLSDVVSIAVKDGPDFIQQCTVRFLIRRREDHA